MRPIRELSIAHFAAIVLDRLTNLRAYLRVALDESRPQVGIQPEHVMHDQHLPVAVLAGAYGVGKADALAYGIILQAVEIATAVIMGAPALVKEGMSWRDVRLRALHASPVQLDPLPAPARDTARAEA